ncbi:hypothetical protein K488DRAFT_89589 [Vararia minispora EC-137]|uniref:Uncharacterized protein n=1 Tax=Vararia minispora EC-137 TaxID=1314806 RepID=A0ACB8QA44_9AGAM|nr:hypothetical protein K488DRAFT_89589 [Vararia minispora EC-137]
MVLMVAVALSSLLLSADPKGKLNIVNLTTRTGGTRGRPRAKIDQIRVNFNSTADLRPLFNWNTKQLFVWVQAEYISAKGTQNQIVLWDDIIQRKEDALLNLRARNEYVIHDLSFKFAGASPLNFTLKYNVMPYVGLLTYGEAATTTKPIPFPKPLEK